MEKKWWQIVSENTPLCLTLIGGALFVTGAAGVWPAPQVKVYEPAGRIALAVVGGAALGLGILLMWRKESKVGPHRVLDPKRYGIKITFPDANIPVGEEFDVIGDYQIKPPDDLIVKVLDQSPISGRYWPKKNRIDYEEGPKKWRVRSISIKIAPGDERILVVAMMGKNGQTLCDYYHEVAELINQLRKQHQDPTIRLPGIVPNAAIVECDRVTIRRAP